VFLPEGAGVAVEQADFADYETPQTFTIQQRPDWSSH
jgi:hypothetical protein